MPARPVATATGAWALNASANASYYFDQAFAAAVTTLVLNDSDPEGSRTSLLDVGAGVGRYVGYYRNRGIDARGIDGMTDVRSRSNGLVEEVELTTMLPINLSCHPVGTVVCTEVLEHIPIPHETRLIEWLSCMADRRIVLSWAHPGQRGNGHVNLRGEAYVRDRFAAHGWVVMDWETRTLRTASVLPWYRANLLSLVHRSYLVH